VEGVAFLLGRRRAILADDMGLGKTRQSIVALAEAAPVGPRLVVSPASVKRHWAREILAARPDDAVHVVGPADPPDVGYTGWVVVNYDILARYDAMLEDLPWTGLVFDEAHYLKNHTSQRSKLARELVAAAPGAVLHALTGTPLTNRPRDLFPLLQLVGHPLGRSFLAFAQRYCDARHNGFGWVADGASHLAELRAQLQGVMLRRTKAEVLDLPPKLRAWVPVAVPPGTAQRETRRVLARLLDRQRAGAGGRGRGAQGGAGQESVRLLADLTAARAAIARAKAATTIEFVEGVVAQGEKAVVFSGFDEPVRRIAAHFGAQAVVLTGDTPAARRQALVDRFQEDPGVRVFVANLVAGGVGITLTAARQVVFNDLDWVPANHWQAEDRAYRIGQAGAVNVTYFTAVGTIDEFVSRALAAKGALVDAVVEARSEARGEEEGGDVLTELEAMVRTLSPGSAADGDIDGPPEGLPDGDEELVDRLLRAVAARAARAEAREVGAIALARPQRPPTEAIRALAQVLRGPGTSGEAPPR
jgi:SWI/SNF-related matrix-associated actin-dependent regulator of chromatin subfamily A-like protein 1